MAQIELSDIDKSLVDKYGFAITMSGDRYVVRDPENKKLGKGGRLEGGNLTSLLVQAEEARKTAPPPFGKVTKTKAARVVPPKETPTTEAPNAPTAALAPRAKSTKDMSSMNAVYMAVLNGAEPLSVYKMLTEQGVRLQSQASTYTHAAICKRVRDLAREAGMFNMPPEDDRGL